MREVSRHQIAVAAGVALAVLAFVFAFVLTTTTRPGAAVAQEPAKAGADALPVLAAGFVTDEGKLARAAGAKLSVKKDEVRDKPFGGEGAGVYHVTFAQKLSSVPVVVVTADVAAEIALTTTMEGFTVSCSSVKDRRRVGVDRGFNFIVVKVSERTP
jgi:hypothetical protein